MTNEEKIQILNTIAKFWLSNDEKLIGIGISNWGGASHVRTRYLTSDIEYDLSILYRMITDTPSMDIYRSFPFNDFDSKWEEV